MVLSLPTRGSLNRIIVACSRWLDEDIELTIDCAERWRDKIPKEIDARRTQHDRFFPMQCMLSLSRCGYMRSPCFWHSTDDDPHEAWITRLENDLVKAQELIDWLRKRKDEIIAVEASRHRIEEVRMRRQCEQEEERRRAEEDAREYNLWRIRQQERLAAGARAHVRTRR